MVYGSDEFERELVTIARFDANDLCTLGVLFDADDLDDALAELGRLASEPGAAASSGDTRRTYVRWNRAARVAEENLHLVAAGRGEELRARTRPEFVMDYRRSGLRHDQDVDEAVQSAV